MSEGGTNTPGNPAAAGANASGPNAPGESSAVESSILALRKRLLMVAAFAGVASLLGLIPFGDDADPLSDAFQAYLLGFIYVLGFGMGCLALNLLHNVTSGAWGFSIKRILLAGQKTIPFIALLFIPLLIAAWCKSSSFYVWTDDHIHDPILERKAVYLNLEFWTGRAVVFFAIWMGIAALTAKLWRRYEESGYDGWAGRQLRRVSAPLLIVYVLTMTFGSFDWVMSLEHHWFSTMYPALFCVGQALTVFAFSLVTVNWLTRRAPVFASHYAKKQFHDVSALMFAFIVLWTYMSFAQFLIIWSGHLPEETTWYIRRMNGGWQGVMGVLALFHFLVPFLLLLRLKWKKSAPFLYWCAGGMLGMRLLDLIWQIAPASQHIHEDLDHRVDGLMASVSIMDITVPVALVCLWGAMFANHLRKAPLMVLEGGKLKTAFEEPPTPLQAKVASR